MYGDFITFRLKPSGDKLTIHLLQADKVVDVRANPSISVISDRVYSIESEALDDVWSHIIFFMSATC